MTYDLTTLGFKSPQAGESVQLWTHFKQLADSVQAEYDGRPGCTIRSNAGGQSIPNNSSTVADFDTTDEDSGGMADLVNNRILVTRAGLYLVTLGWCYTSTNTTGTRDVLLRRRDSVAGIDKNLACSYLPAAAGFMMGAITSRLTRCVVGDYFFGLYLHSAGVAQVTPNTNDNLFLSAQWVKP